MVPPVQHDEGQEVSHIYTTEQDSSRQRDVRGFVVVVFTVLGIEYQISLGQNTQSALNYV